MKNEPENMPSADMQTNSLSTLDLLTPEDVNYDPEQFAPLEPGSLFGEFQNYRLEKKLGEGGMGQTWLATKISGGEEVQQVVCKILSDRIRKNENAMKEVQRVFELTKKAFHQNICPLLGIETDKNFGKFLIMAHIENGTLEDWFKAQPGYENGLPLEKLLPILSPIAKALDFIHELGILHRDVKPQNIMFQKIGRHNVPCLIDFGIAARIRQECVTQETMNLSRSTDTVVNSSSGTPVYMAPEQMQNYPQNGRADQYALAMVLYELTHGKLPFSNENVIAIAVNKMSLSATAPHLSDSAKAVLDRALSFQSDARFSSCSEFLATLQEAQKNASPLPASAAPPSAPAAPIPLTLGGKTSLRDVFQGISPYFASTSGRASERHAGELMVQKVGDIKYAFRWCPPGTFTRGEDENAHKVTLTHGFWMLETQVTQAMWKNVMKNEPSYFPGSQNPVERVKWTDCLEFCRKLSAKLGLKVFLPTEAQWEYACRAGTEGDHAGVLGKMAWYGTNSKSTHPVKQKEPNAWSLYDMHGNVWEWCWDLYGAYLPNDVSDPQGPNCGKYRVRRGGGWNSDANDCGSAFRNYCPENYYFNNLGFRILIPEQNR
ncbi:MAG: hypothetical protein E7029_11985 [Planctomycetaceae bacterium]|nr:hypothetical protein [Planctomycetaceae bacterium]